MTTYSKDYRYSYTLNDEGNLIIRDAESLTPEQYEAKELPPIVWVGKPSDKPTVSQLDTLACELAQYPRSMYDFSKGDSFTLFSGQVRGTYDGGTDLHTARPSRYYVKAVEGRKLTLADTEEKCTFTCDANNVYAILSIQSEFKRLAFCSGDLVQKHYETAPMRLVSFLGFKGDRERWQVESADANKYPCGQSLYSRNDR